MPPSPSAPWEQVLEQIEHSLQQILAAAAEPPDPEGGAGAVDWGGWEESLRLLRQRLDQALASVAKAEQDAAAVEAALAADAEALERWRAAAAGRGLADGGGASV